MNTYTRIVQRSSLEGELKCELKAKTEILLSLFDDGFDLQKIVKLTKLSTEEAIEILKENGRSI